MNKCELAWEQVPLDQIDVKGLTMYKLNEISDKIKPPRASLTPKIGRVIVFWSLKSDKNLRKMNFRKRVDKMKICQKTSKL